MIQNIEDRKFLSNPDFEFKTFGNTVQYITSRSPRQIRYSRAINVVKHIEMPKAAPQQSICHFQKLEMILK